MIRPTILAIILATLALSLNAQSTPQAVTSAINSYNDWQEVELNGKLHLDNLFISPSIKVYMKHNTQIMISARVPFKGEVARVEIDTTGILIVNRLKKIYCREQAGDILRSVPASLSDIQTTLLGRIWILGSGQITSASAKNMNFSQEEDCIVCVPTTQPFNGNAQYGFTLGYDTMLQALYATTTYADLSILLEYDFKQNKKYDISAQWSDSKHTYSGVKISFDAPNWECTPMDPWLDNAKYKRVGISEIIKF